MVGHTGGGDMRERTDLDDFTPNPPEPPTLFDYLLPIAVPIVLCTLAGGGIGYIADQYGNPYNHSHPNMIHGAKIGALVGVSIDFIVAGAFGLSKLIKRRRG